MTAASLHIAKISFQTGPGAFPGLAAVFSQATLSGPGGTGQVPRSAGFDVGPRFSPHRQGIIANP